MLQERCYYLPEYLCMALRITVSLALACIMSSLARLCLYMYLGAHPVNEYRKDLLSLCLKSDSIGFAYVFS